MDSTIYQPLSCQSLFSNALPLERLKKSIYLCHCPSDENSESRSHFFHRREKNSLDFDSGKYHLLVLTHKFPVLQKFLGDLPNRSNMFAEAIVLPWYLLVYGKHKDSVMTMVYSGHCKNSVGNFARPQKHLAHKRCKCEQNSAEVSKHSLNDAENGLSSFCSSHSSSCIENTSVSNNWLEFPFLTAGKGVNLHWKGMLHSTDEHSEFISDCKLPRRKILLEFGLDSFCEYEALKIGRCYLVKHQEALKLCNTKENNQVSCAKVFITSGTHISSVTFSSVECLQSASVVDGFPLCNLPISSDELIPKGCWEYEIPCLIGNSGGSGIYSDVNIFVPSSALNLLENSIKMVCIPDEPIDSFAEETGIHDHSGSMINASMQPSITSCSDCSLPEGNLITLQGLVLAFHDCHSVPFPAQRCARRGEGSLLMFLQEHAGVCVHVFTDNHIVTIFCNLKKETYPVGLGRDVYATFHRILVLSEPNKYMTTPVSFITIDHTSLMCVNLSHDLNYASGTVGLHSVASPKTFPTSLISDALQSSELQPMQFRCRVVALYILVLEKTGTTATSQSCLQSTRYSFGVPFAGFIMDDASGTCCCWVDLERAAAFLGLESQEYLLQLLEQHGRIVVKNYGDMFDSSCHDLTFSVESAERFLSSSDENDLGSLISNAFFGTSWSVVGSVMDEESTRWLEERLSELEVGVPPLINMWATCVSRPDMLAEARNIINGGLL